MIVMVMVIVQYHLITSYLIFIKIFTRTNCLTASLAEGDNSTKKSKSSCRLVIVMGLIMNMKLKVILVRIATMMSKC